jgi:hypothetical protein
MRPPADRLTFVENWAARASGVTQRVAQAALAQLTRGSLALFAVMLAIQGCTGVSSEPARGMGWSYTGVSDSVQSWRMIAFFQASSDCELARANDTYGLLKSAPGSKVNVSSACQETAVGAGSDYWVFGTSTPHGTAAIGANTADSCEALRKDFRASATGSCLPLGVRIAGQR